tara:strand:+ start:41 stop:211 length:171 start_codon:yes stop_codon:yes gene_type:complete
VAFHHFDLMTDVACLNVASMVSAGEGSANVPVLTKKEFSMEVAAIVRIVDVEKSGH